MRSLIALLVALGLWAQAAFAFYIDTNVSTTQVTATALTVGTVSATQANVGGISSTGTISASSAYSNYNREGLGTVTATGSTTTLDFKTMSNIRTTISANSTVSFTNIPTATSGYITQDLCQDSTGGRTWNYPSNARFNGNTSPTLTTAAGTCSKLTYQVISGTTGGLPNILVTMAATGVSP